MNVIFGSGLVAPAAPGSIFAVYSSLAKGSAVGVSLCWSSALVVTFVIASLLLKFERSEDEIDLAAATAQMEANKGKKSSVAGVLTGQRANTGEIRSIVFACDAGMGSSAMGASVLRKKVHEAGFPEVTVVNKAISNLQDEFDLVVTHRDLSDRARAKTPSALLVPVDNFMASPRYDEIVELVRESKGGSAAGAHTGTHAAPAQDAGMPGGLLSDDAIVLDAPAGESRDIAITRAGGLLVASGAVDRSYVDAMHERETSVSTAMGNLLAIPHGTNEAKSAVTRTALSFVRYPEPIDWNGKPVRYVVGIAALGNEHLKLLGRIAEVFVDPEQVARLENATSPADVRAVLGEVAPV
jgi:PTS system mannitol-specific IIC component